MSEHHPLRDWLQAFPLPSVVASLLVGLLVLIGFYYLLTDSL
ncbi:hypothetical protein FAES_3210 [Fibrella aestuarina BUZ 2]|uniref:Uncharacterized protein n=1 Tax=Fibrella aestuarina BUZ 2 TaxID=1166018 RepID=I0KAR6_9BACT|nr:hypothetical protein [Fibrella aestuarina]CCH01219.1 hypothetical protein FAES_3210 [Fibrella aestuarina BUZ 2]